MLKSFKIRHLALACIVMLGALPARAAVIPITLITYSDATYTTVTASYNDGDTAYVGALFQTLPTGGALNSLISGASLTGLQLTATGGLIHLLSGGLISAAGIDRSLSLGAVTALPTLAGNQVTLDFSYEIDTLLDPGPIHSLTATGSLIQRDPFFIPPATTTVDTLFLDATATGAVTIASPPTAISSPDGIALLIGGLVFAAARRRKFRAG